MSIQSIIYFDGVCNLCSAAVQFIIKRDTRNVFSFASLQSDFANQSVKLFDIRFEQVDSIILVENDKIYYRSTAALRIARKLNGLWSLLYVFIIVPSFIRDAVYNYIAKNRYLWYGKKESCWVPTPELKNKFLG